MRIPRLRPLKMLPNCKDCSKKLRRFGRPSKPKMRLISRNARVMPPRQLALQPRAIRRRRWNRTQVFRKIAAAATSHTARTPVRVSLSDRKQVLVSRNRLYASTDYYFGFDHILGHV